ncbi:type II secretion system protein [Geovibrio thiophilus]|uniref:Type II secretion system protein n=1 Tax=Geovibrio thiophilus TaxID=139438 RepID=A0A410JV35_9BACT|nr:type II secretion system protein [Geovibrio thiophilus]QAR32070.1 type II secretion system protein [Geovibrio thiophilus]
MRDNRGFTLMEVLVSMVIMSVIMLSLAYGYIIVKQRNLSDLMRHKAEEVIQTVFEEFRTMDFDDLEDQPASLPDDLEFDETQNLNAYCDPEDDEVPDDPICTGRFVFRSSSGEDVGRVDYEVVYKVFSDDADNLGLENSASVVATICWRHRGDLKFLSRKSVIMKEGML